MEYMDIISLIVLCATLIGAFLFKLNSGVISIAVALILARITGITDKALFSYFNSSLFVMLFGVMLLFSIAQQNKTLELLAKKTLALCRGNTWVLPVVVFIFSGVFSAIGPGLISMTALMSVLVISLAKEMKMPAIRLAPFGLLGSFAGGLSPVTPTGIVAVNVSAASGITGVGGPVALGMALTCALYALVLYILFFIIRRDKTELAPKYTPTPSEPINYKQVLTLLGILATCAVSTVLNINVGLVAIVVSVILVLFRCADEGAALKSIPWGTLIMITGVGILISVVTELKGIQLLENGLKSLSTEKTVAPIMTTLSGVMSWVSSASGVVMPTLIPTVPGIVEEMNTVSGTELVNCISIGANMAALSPLSTCGGLMLAAFSTSGVTAKERNKMFVQLFALSACAVLFAALLAFLGLY